MGAPYFLFVLEIRVSITDCFRGLLLNPKHERLPNLKSVSQSADSVRAREVISRVRACVCVCVCVCVMIMLVGI